MSAAPELRALTGARGIAAWWVVLFHLRLSIDDLPPPVMAVLAKGYLAVDFFFLLSGFVIQLSWGARLRDGGIRAVPRFLLGRVARVWPLHVVVLGAFAAFAALVAAAGRADGTHYPWAELPLHLLLIHNWGLTDAIRWNDPSWSISAEMGAYLLFAALAVAADWRRLSAPTLVALAAAPLLLLHLLMRGEPGLGVDIARYGLPRCLAEFVAGTVLAELWSRGRRRRASAGAGAALLCAAAFAAWVAGAPETLVVPSAFAAGLLALAWSAGAPRHPLEGRAAHWLGRISYATYLSHFLLWILFKIVVVDGSGAIGPTELALFVALLLLASALLHHRVERPAQRWIASAPTRPRARAALAVHADPRGT